MKRIQPLSTRILALAAAIALIIAGLVGTAVVANAAAPVKKAWNFDLSTTDEAPGGNVAGTVTWKKSGKCYNAGIRSALSDREAGDAHGAVAWFSYVDCKSGKTKNIKLSTTATTRTRLLMKSLKNVKNVRVLICLYQGSDEHRFCNTKGAS